MRPKGKQRRAFGTIRGATEGEGDPAVLALLDQAWKAVEGDGRQLTHGFHAYPARAHSLLVRALLESFSKPGQRILDPFSGSGTVAVEALAAGRDAVVSDINRVGLAMTSMKVQRLDGPARKRLEASAKHVATRAARARREIPELAEVGALEPLFAPSTLKELLTLREAIASLHDQDHRRALRSVLSSILVKLSHRESETESRLVRKNFPPGFAYQLFRDRTTELALGMRSLRHQAPDGTPTPLVCEADARRLPLRSHSIDLALTSPPYLGTYDYTLFQSLRMLFFETPLPPGRSPEIGSRTDASVGMNQVLERYRADLAKALTELGRVLKPEGVCVLIIGDSSAGQRFIAADQALRDASRKTPLGLIARCSQPRPTLHGKKAFEHLIALGKR